MSTIAGGFEGLRSVPREIPGVVEGFRRNHLLIYASAIAFQVLTALVPGLLFAFGLLGFLDLTVVWEKELRPAIVESVSIPALSVIDSTVEQVFESKQLFWVTLGAMLAVYQLSGAVRAAMEALNRVQQIEEDRPWLARFARSVLLAMGTGALIILAMLSIVAVPLVLGEVSGVLQVAIGVLRWVLAAALLGVAVGLIVHYGPNCPQPLGWVSLGAGLIIAAWLAMSALFGLYLGTVASYGSIFGNLATVVILLAYLYASSIVFLAGAQMDALLRKRDADG